VTELGDGAEQETMLGVDAIDGVLTASSKESLTRTKERERKGICKSIPEKVKRPRIQADGT